MLKLNEMQVDLKIEDDIGARTECSEKDSACELALQKVDELEAALGDTKNVSLFAYGDYTSFWK